MSTFVIDAENSITAVDSPEEAQAGETFGSEEKLAELAAKWPSSRLVEVWNGIPGLTPVKKFRDRGTAINRIWNAIQSLNGTRIENQAATPTARSGKKSREPKALRKKSGKVPAPRKSARQPAAREGSKKQQVLSLLQQKGGATLKEIMKATDWQAHSVRGFISGTLTRRMRLKVESTKREDGERVYHIAR